jgi:cytochrome d ubiquinol oxidase subunit II
MLVGLIFRGVAFEFRFKATDRERPSGTRPSSAARWWRLLPGRVAGRLPVRDPVSGRSYAGGPLDWFAPFPLAGRLRRDDRLYAAGRTWLVMKTEGELHRRMVQAGAAVHLAAAGGVVVVSVWTPLSQHQVAERWFSFPNIVFLSPVPLLVAAPIFWLLWSLKARSAPPALRRRAGPGAAGLHGHGDQHLAAHRAARHHDLGSGGAAQPPSTSRWSAR